MDIAVHHDDGPLLLFPVQWSLRFSSPLSYWDPAHYGDVIGPIDLSITVVGGIVLLAGHLRTRSRRRQAASADGGEDPMRVE